MIHFTWHKDAFTRLCICHGMCHDTRNIFSASKANKQYTARTNTTCKSKLIFCNCRVSVHVLILKAEELFQGGSVLALGVKTQP